MKMTETKSTMIKTSKKEKKTMKSKIIVFEGMDGAGKTYLLNEVRKKLTQKNRTVLPLSNPYGQSKKSWTGRLHASIIQEKIDPINQALLYAAIVMENQKIYRNKRYDYVLIDRYIHSTFAYNVFYPTFADNSARSDPNIASLCRFLIKTFCASVESSQNLPCQTFIVKSVAENFNLPGFDAELLEKSYEATEEAMDKIYRQFGARYYQETVFNDHRNKELINDIMKRIFAL